MALRFGSKCALFLRVATANVNTLRPKFDNDVQSDRGVDVAARAQLLEIAFREAALDFVGIQEGRAKSDGLRSGVYYDMVVAGATPMGLYGNQLWIRADLQYKLQATNVHSPRLLQVDVLLQNCCEVIILVAHAPHEHDTVDNKNSFWALLLGVTLRAQLCKPAAHVLLCIDANARFGSVPSAYVGDTAPNCENDNGGRFRRFLEESALYALNTFYDAGHTWVSSFGNATRIDYIASSVRPGPDVHFIEVLGDIELATSDREDHRLLAGGLSLEPNLLVGRSPKRPTQKTNKANLHNPWMQQLFQDALWTFEPQAGANIDEHHFQFTEFAKRQAIAAFGVQPRLPRQPWISAASWSVVKLVAPLRRLQYRAFAACNSAWLLYTWLAWRSLLPEVFVLDPSPELHARVLSAKGWRAHAALQAASAARSQRNRVVAVVLRSITLLHVAVVRYTRQDRLDFIEGMALRAQSAALSCDFRTSFQLVRLLAGCTPRPLQAVRLKDGRLSATAAQRDARWQEHYCDLFNGYVVDNPSVLVTRPGALAQHHEFRHSCSQLEGAIQRLGNNKGLGPDELPAEVAKAGGSAFAVKLYGITSRIVGEERWPVQWKGGRLASLWKKKGSATECANSRGLLVSDHISKAFTDILKDELQPQLRAHIPDNQYGGMAGGGTDIPNHTIRSVLQYAKLFALSVFVLFLDLEKAFDKVIREIVMGWPQSEDGSFASESQQREYLRSIGVAERAADHIVELMRDKGSVFRQWQVDPKVEALVRGLHTKAWFRVGDNESVVVTSTGGRQGCKLGGIIFNSVYEQALEQVRQRLRSAGVVLVLKVAGSEPFWASDDGTWDTSDAPVVEVTYVDDEAAVVVSRSPAALDTAIEILLQSYVDVFSDYGLVINWQKGKSEALLVYRGKRAVQHLDARRDASGGISILVPGGDGRRLHVVPAYRHLGGIICSNCNIIPEINHRVTSAMASYVPIAGRVFGAAFVALHVRLSLMRSLVLSRLLFNVHTLTMSVAGLRKINGPYMRVLRSIAGERRFCEHNNIPDIEVRRMVGQPSIDSIVLQKRLAYYPKLARRQPTALVALLQTQCSSDRLPWVRQAIGDLDFVYQNVGVLSLPPPQSEPRVWVEFMLQEEIEWKRAVESCTFVHSKLDASADGMSPAAAHGAHVCLLCDTPQPAFCSPKALASHQRVKHGIRNPMRAFAEADGRCPVCRTLFHTRLRLLAHLSDERRPKCRDALMAGAVQPLSARRILELDALDKVARRDAHRLGYTHPLAVGRALTADGRRTGHVQF